MKISNLRQESVNTMTVEIDGKKFRIHGDDEIGRYEAKIRIPAALYESDTLAEVRESLSFYGISIIKAST